MIAWRSWLSLSLVAILGGCGFNTPTVISNSVAEISLPDQPVAYIQAGQLWLSGTNTTPQLIDHLPGAVSSVTWLDHHQLLYTVAVEERYETWLQDLTTRQAHYITDWRTAPSNVAVAPNHAAFTVIVDNALYVVVVADGRRVRVDEAATVASWSPSSQQIIFTTTDNRLLLQDISFDFTLDTPLVLLNQTITAPVFLDEQTIVFEMEQDGKHMLATLDLVTQTISTFTSLAFTTTDAHVTSLEPQLNGDQVLYARLDDATQDPVIWVLHRTKDAPKLILTKASQPAWSSNYTLVYYIVGSELWQATSSGFNKTKVADDVTAFATDNRGIQL